MKVVVIEDQTAMREMLVMFLGTEPGFTVVGEIGDGQAAFDLCIAKKPDIVILDIMLPGLNGVELLRRLRKHLPKVRTVVFSGHQNVTLVKESLQAGANAYVEKMAGLADLKRAIRTVADGGSFFGPTIANLLRDAVLNPGYDPQSSDILLTAREREVLQLIAESHSTKEIAAKLSVSVKTADNHRTNLMRKLNLHNVASLTRYAIQIGVIEPPTRLSSSDETTGE